jgi:hypothetical protein
LNGRDLSTQGMTYYEYVLDKVVRGRFCIRELFSEELALICLNGKIMSFLKPLVRDKTV